MQHSEEFIALVDDALTRVRTCEISEVKEIIDGSDESIIIDVRDNHEYEKGFIPGAIHLSRGLLEVNVIQSFPDKNAHYILYCGGGNRSALSADNLQKMGYQNVLSMNGGFKAWANKGYPIEGYQG